MTTPSSHDLIQLSAYLDGELQPAEKARLEQRLATDSALRAALEDLRQTRSLLRQMPLRRPPRNFTLTPRTQNVRPPLPRLTLALSWSSLLLLLLFLLVLGGSILPSLGAAAPALMKAESPGRGGEGPFMVMEAEETLAAPTLLTPEASLAQQPIPLPEMRTLVQEPPASENTGLPVWWWAIPGLALGLFGFAWGLRWAQLRAFRKRYLKK